MILGYIVTRLIALILYREHAWHFLFACNWFGFQFLTSLFVWPRCYNDPGLNDTQPRQHPPLSMCWHATTHYYCLCSGQPSMWCFLFLTTVLRLPNPLRGRLCLNTRLSLQRGHGSVPIYKHIDTHTGPPGNVWGHGPASPSGLTDLLALVRYLRVTAGFNVVGRPLWCRQDVLCTILFLHETKTQQYSKRTVVCQVCAKKKPTKP